MSETMQVPVLGLGAEQTHAWTQLLLALALENIRNGPVYIPSDHYRGLFAHLLSLPRREALTAMARSRKT